MSLRLPLTLLFLIIQLNCPAGNTSILNFETAWQRTLCNSPALHAAEFELSIKSAERCQASLYPNPVASVEIENIGGSGDYQDMDEAQNTYSIYQTFELGGKRAARRNLASAEIGVAYGQAELVRQELKYQLQVAFINVFAAQEKFCLAKSKEMISQTVVSIVDAQVRAGKASIIQRKKAEIALKATQLESIEALSLLKQARKSLSLMWGCACPDFEQVTFPFFCLSPPPIACRLAWWVWQTPELVKSQREIAAATYNLKLQHANRVPDLTLSAGYRTFNDTNSSAFVVGAQIPLPLFDQNQGNIKAACYTIQQLKEIQRELVQELQTSLMNAHQQWIAAFEKAELIRNGMLIDALETFELSKEGYERGKLDYLDLLDAQRTLFEVQELYIDLLAFYQIKKAGVERLSGYHSCKVET